MRKSQAEGCLSVTHQQQQQQLIDDDRAIEKPQVTLSRCNVKLANTLIPKMNKEQGKPENFRGVGAGPAGTTAAGPMLEAKLMNLIKGLLQKF